MIHYLNDILLKQSLSFYLLESLYLKLYKFYFTLITSGFKSEVIKVRCSSKIQKYRTTFLSQSNSYKDINFNYKGICLRDLEPLDFRLKCGLNSFKLILMVGVKDV